MGCLVSCLYIMLLQVRIGYNLRIQDNVGQNKTLSDNLNTGVVLPLSLPTLLLAACSLVQFYKCITVDTSIASLKDIPNIQSVGWRWDLQFVTFEQFNLSSVISIQSVLYFRVQPPASYKLCKHHPRYCSWCESSAPTSSKHCHQCRICVLQKDHHCHFTGRCIGKNNLPHFMVRKL